MTDSEQKPPFWQRFWQTTRYRLWAWQRNAAYRRWAKANPGKRYCDFDVERAVDLVEAGEHRTIGSRLRSGAAHEDSGKRWGFDLLLKHGLKPEHVCVDYGCGSLRVGQHVMAHLAPGNYWGLDVTDRFFQMGLELLPESLVAEKKPHLHIITPQVLDQVRTAEPDVVFSLNVLFHVPEPELEGFFSDFLRMFSEKTVGWVEYREPREQVTVPGVNLFYPRKTVANAITAAGGEAEFIPTGHNRKTPLDLVGHWIKIRKSGD